MKNKIITSIIAMLLIVSFSITMTSCGKTNESGSFEDVEISDDSGSSEDDKNTFTELDVPFGYSTKKVNIGMAYSTIKIPRTYEILVRNARNVEIQAPEDDTNLHGATMHLLYNFASYNFTVSPDGTGEESPYEESSEYFFDKFAWELPAMTYHVNGRNYTLREQELADKTILGASFTKNDEDVTCTIASGVDLLSSSLDHGPEGCSQITYYFRWNGIASCLSTVVAKDDVEAARRIMEYIISSTKYLPSKVGTEKVFELKNCTVRLPEYMEIDSTSASNIAVVPLNRTSNDAAGIAVGVFSVDTRKTDKITVETMNSSYGEQMAKALSPSGNNYRYYSSTEEVNASPKSISGKPAKHYESIVTCDGGGTTESNPLAGSFLGDPATCQFETLVINDGDTQRALCVWYILPQKDTAQKILRTAANTLTYEK